MTVQEIHEYIWGRVLEERGKLGHKYIALTGLKDKFKVERIKYEAIEKLYLDGKITGEARELLSEYSHCVLCTVYNCCGNCPLNKLGLTSKCGVYSTYHRALQGDVDSIKAILSIDVTSGSNIDTELVHVLEAG